MLRDAKRATGRERRKLFSPSPSRGRMGETFMSTRSPLAHTRVPPPFFQEPISSQLCILSFSRCWTQMDPFECQKKISPVTPPPSNQKNGRSSPEKQRRGLVVFLERRARVTSSLFSFFFRLFFWLFFKTRGKDRRTPSLSKHARKNFPHPVKHIEHNGFRRRQAAGGGRASPRRERQPLHHVSHCPPRHLGDVQEGGGFFLDRR